MNEISLRKYLTASLKEGNAHLTLNDALENVNPDFRFRRPADNVHSVWELLEHIRLAQEDILRYTIVPKWESPVWPDGYWPLYEPEKNKEISDTMWEESISKFNSDLEELIILVNDPGIDLTSVIPHTSNHTYLREILITIDHNSYHTGQIITARKLLGDWRD